MTGKLGTPSPLVRVAAMISLEMAAVCGCAGSNGSRFVHVDGVATLAPHGDLDQLEAGYGLRVALGGNDERTWRRDSGHYLEWTRHEVAGGQEAFDLFSMGYLYRVRILRGPSPVVEPVVVAGPSIGRFDAPASDAWLAGGVVAGLGLRAGAGPSSSAMLSVSYSAWLGTGGESAGWGSAALSVTFRM